MEPVRGGWGDLSWNGWWGDDPPFHAPVFVLTHYLRQSLTMQGGTTFDFVTGGIEQALERAGAAAGGKDVRIGGGVATIRQYVEARLIDELHFASVPVLLGTGESMFRDLDFSRFGYRISKWVASEAAMHVVIEREA
jgi:dihydrofolate reductase